MFHIWSFLSLDLSVLVYSLSSFFLKFFHICDGNHFLCNQSNLVWHKIACLYILDIPTLLKLTKRAIVATLNTHLSPRIAIPYNTITTVNQHGFSSDLAQSSLNIVVIGLLSVISLCFFLFHRPWLLEVENPPWSMVHGLYLVTSHC